MTWGGGGVVWGSGEINIAYVQTDNDILFYVRSLWSLYPSFNYDGGLFFNGFESTCLGDMVVLWERTQEPWRMTL